MAKRKALHDTASGMELEHVCGRIEGDPGGVTAPTGSDPSSPHNRKPRLAVSISAPPDACYREHVIALLDAVRQQYDAARLNRLRYIRLARRYGLTYSEIGDLLGMTDGGVRMAAKRAGEDL